MVGNKTNDEFWSDTLGMIKNVFLAIPPNFEYQNEKRGAANHSYLLKKLST